jgi:hypothetical protein
VPARRPRHRRRHGFVARVRLPRFDRRARVIALCALACVVGYVLSVNALVRTLGGGDPHLLSPRHHAQKAHALGRLGLHALGELGLWPHADPRPAVTSAAVRHRVSPALALAVARVESSWQPHAISRTGAMGLMQLMPDTARELSVVDPFDPAHNADGAVRYLKSLLARYAGDAERAVAAYNVGPARVARVGPLRVPGETRAYVAAVLRAAGLRRAQAQSASAASWAPADGYSASRANTLQR